MNNKLIGIAADHAGFALKEELKAWLIGQGYDVKDFGTHSEDSTDYPDYVHPLSTAIEKEEISRGLMVCGSGQGVCMTANKYPHIRAALVWNHDIASLSRTHNDANVICLPARFIEAGDARKFLETFLNTEFEGGRHSRRVNKIAIPE